MQLRNYSHRIYMESDQQRSERLLENRQRIEVNRANESDQQRNERLLENRQRIGVNRDNESDQQRNEKANVHAIKKL